MDMFKNSLRKIISSALMTFFLLGVFGLVAVQPGQSYAAASPIGVVDYGVLLDKHPDTKSANEALKAENEQAKKEFQDKSATLSDQEKQELNAQLLQRVEQKRRELLGPILDKINAAIKEVATAKGLTVVLNKAATVYGGQDITGEVVDKITGK